MPSLRRLSLLSCLAAACSSGGDHPLMAFPTATMSPAAAMQMAVPPGPPPVTPAPAIPMAAAGAQANAAGSGAPAPEPAAPPRPAPEPEPTAPSTDAATPDPVADHQPRIAFLALRVVDVDKTVDFYVRLIGMKEQGRTTEGETTEVALAFPEPGGAALHLVSTPGLGPVQHGNAYSRFGLRVGDIPALISSLRAAGATIVQEPARTESLKLTYAMVRDPEGYMIELLQFDPPAMGSAPAAQLPRLAFLSFNLTDVDRALGFYDRVLGLTRRGGFDVGNGTMEIFVSYMETLPGEATLVLLSNANRRGALQHGDGFDRFALRVPDVAAVASQLAAENVALTQPVQRDDGLGVTSARFADPDGYNIELLQY